jgi:hypothetical protein
MAMMLSPNTIYDYAAAFSVAADTGCHWCHTSIYMAQHPKNSGLVREQPIK